MHFPPVLCVVCPSFAPPGKRDGKRGGKRGGRPCKAGRTHYPPRLGEEHMADKEGRGRSLCAFPGARHRLGASRAPAAQHGRGKPGAPRATCPARMSRTCSQGPEGPAVARHLPRAPAGPHPRRREGDRRAEMQLRRPELLWETLGILPGAVSPFGLINDSGHRVTPALDRQMLGHDPINAHPLHNRGDDGRCRRRLPSLFRITGHAPVLRRLRCARGEGAGPQRGLRRLRNGRAGSI